MIIVGSYEFEFEYVFSVHLGSEVFHALSEVDHYDSIRHFVVLPQNDLAVGEIVRRFDVIVKQSAFVVDDPKGEGLCVAIVASEHEV